MDIKITPNYLNGDIEAPASKSQAHRAIWCAALSDGPTELELNNVSDDIRATLDCFKSLGADVAEEAGRIMLSPVRTSEAMRGEYRVHESGTTLRFLLPLIGVLNAQETKKKTEEKKEGKIITAGRLIDRPISPLKEELEVHGMKIEKGRNSIAVDGRLSSGTYTLAGNVSSQYISGLLLALPLLSRDSDIVITGKRASLGYINMTLDVQKKFGYVAGETKKGFHIKGNGMPAYTTPDRFKVEGDWSNAAFWLVAAELMRTNGDRNRENISISGLDNSSCQADAYVAEAIRMISNGGATINGDQIPDLIPVLAVLAGVTPGETVFEDIGRLRDKESDRLEATVSMISVLGGDAFATDDRLHVRGVDRYRGGCVDSYNDHRIAMSAAVAAIASDGAVIIKKADAISKSYPGFYDDYRSLGGTVEEV